ncbi:MAG: metallophosphoesterase [Tannerella sp.]|nr:metallophosphoesterase [Tannerella sp.]
MGYFFIVMLLAFVASNIYIFARGVQTIPHFPVWTKWAIGIIYWFCALSFIFIFVFRRSMISATWGHTLFEIGTGWLIFTLYMVLMLGCFDLIRLFNKSLPHSFIPALTLVICVLAYGYYRYQHPVTKVINIDINKTNSKSIKIVAISDVHLGLGTVKSQLKKYVDMINAQQPDVILISGDLIDNSIVPVRNQRMAEELNQLRAKYGIYMVPGNHEYISGIDDCVQYIAQTPIRVLRDETVTLPNGVQIVGRDDKSFRRRKKPAALTQDISHEQPIIMLDHQPVEIVQAVEAGVDLLICGHTHHGQVWPLSWVTDRMFDVSYGYVQREKTHIYVSSGLALWGPPFRIGTQSEMIVFQVSF